MRLIVTARAVRLVAATVLVAAAGTVLPAAPAVAATCSSGTGVSVVVDATGVGGALATSCVPGGGGDTAAALFEVHHDLTRTARFPGAVCKVDGAPADAECQNMPPTDAYWGLFWSDGSGGWVYSSEGVDSLNVPNGGSVAFAWQDGGAQDAPGAAPPQTRSEPSASPSSSGGSGGSGGGAGSGGGSTGSGGSGGATTAPSRQPSGSPSSDATADAGRDDRTGPGKRDRDEGDRKREGQKGDGKKNRDRDRDDSEDEPTAPSDDASTTTDPVVTADPPETSDDGLPVWVAPAGIAVLFGIAGVVALLRRRSMA